jgi:GT2 family glycosyltransferase
LEETLSAFRRQDYPNLSVLVIDAASDIDPTPRVAAVLPNAYVRRLRKRVGFARAANEVLDIVEGASHFLFCHDDAALDPEAMRILVEEAFRSNAGIVSPKLVEWDQPDRLIAVGKSADKTGVTSGLAEPGELDQEQHDAVRDVFCAPGPCMLVRADLFAALGGFDPEIDLFEEDLNLSWRVQIAGGRVVVAPSARVRHIGALQSGLREGWYDAGAVGRAAALDEAHRVRTILTCYGLFHLLRVLPQAIVLTLAQAVVQLLTGRVRAASDTLLAWPRALRHPLNLLKARRSVQRHRNMSDTEVRRLQSRGSARIKEFFRSKIGADGRRWPVEAGRTLATSMQSGEWRIPAVAWAVTLLVLLVGTRGLLGGHIADVGGLPVIGGGLSQWWRLWWSGWRPTGLGSVSPAPTALALLSLAGTILLGATGLLRQLLVIGPLIIGPLGIYRAARPLGSSRARAAALIVYAAIPLPYNALGGGRWSGLVAYAAAPWLLSWLCRTGGETPWIAPPQWAVRVVGLGLLLAVTAAFVPAFLVLVPLIGLGLAAGSALANRAIPGLRALLAAVGATVLAIVLLLPWSADVLGSRTTLFGVTMGATGRLGWGAVLRFHTGHVGGSFITWGFVVAAALPLVMGRSWRLAWAARLWGVAVICWSVAWAGGRGWLPVPMSVPEVILAPAAAAVALAVALGVVAFEVDLPEYRFGWRQASLVVATVGVVVASFPVLAAAGNGRWHLPSRGFSDSLAVLNDRAGQGADRVLWVGDPRALPVGSWRLQDGVGYGTSATPTPDLADQWLPHSPGATRVLATDLRLARAGQTAQLGHLLGTMAVRYIVVPSRTGPSDAESRPVPTPSGILAALALQTDLKAVQTDPALTVYENAAWAPARAVLPEEAGPASQLGTAGASQTAPLAGAPAVLPGDWNGHPKGPLPGGRDIYIAAPRNGRWRLSVSGHTVASRPAFAWAMAFPMPTEGGKGVLHFATSPVRYALILLEMAFWLIAISVVIADRRRQRSLAPPESPLLVPSEWFEGADDDEPVVVPRHRQRREPDRVTVDDDDEVWL